MLTRLDHVQIAVRDLEAATERYARLLGRHPAWRAESPSMGARNSVFRLRNGSIQLIAPAGEGPLGHFAQRRLDADGEGPLALTFETEDLEACAKSLAERAIRAGDPVDGFEIEAHSGRKRRWRALPIASRSARGIRVFAVQNLDGRVRDSERSVPAPSCVSGIDHIVIQTRDADASIDVYGGGLGIRLALDRSFDARNVRLVFFRLAGITIELAAPLDRPPDPEGGESADRLWGLAFQVNDVRAMHARLAADPELDVTGVRRGNKPGTQVFSVRSGTCGVPTLLIGPEDEG